jgi:lactoylglutathione lyase
MALVYSGIRVTDPDRSVQFYTEGLGLKETSRGHMSHGGLFIGLQDPNTMQQLELNWYPADSPYNTPYTVGEGLDHLGFEVEDARATYQRLLRLGATPAIEPWLEQDRYWIGFVRDPDGLWIEVQSPTKKE